MSMSLVVAIHKYFGKKEGQSLEGFKQEYDKLTDKDKEDVRVMLEKELGTEVEIKA